MTRQRITIPYTPRRVFLPYHDRAQRWALIVAHRRAGKTVATINDLIRRAVMSTKTEPRLAYIAPYYAQAKDVAWSYLRRFTSPIPGVTYHEGELRADFSNGARIRLYGADNYDRLRGLYLDEVVVDEVADIDPRAWSDVIRPALADRQGGATIIGTPKGRDAFFDAYQRAQADPDWFCSRLPASETGILAASELEAMRADMPPSTYARELECSFDAPVDGAYYADLIATARAEGRVGRVPHDSAAQVHAAWDLGISDATTIVLAQVVGRSVQIIETISDQGRPLAHYAAELRRRPYDYAPLILPHDAQARELGSGRSRVEVLQSLGWRTRLAPQIGVADGIDAVRRLIPRCWIDEDRCADGLAAWTAYRARIDPRRQVDHGPLHDWSSHYADALRYLAVALDEPRASTAARRETASRSWMS